MDDFRWRAPAPAFDGPVLGDPFNAEYSAALVAGTADGLVPDCGHITCSTHCDPLIRQIRSRRDTGSDIARGARRRPGH